MCAAQAPTQKMQYTERATEVLVQSIAEKISYRSANPLKSEQMKLHFETLIQQRVNFYQTMKEKQEQVWRNPQPNKWSAAETLYHLLLMLRLFRKFSTFYIPLMLPIAKRKNKDYQLEIHDIYLEYNQKKKKPMKAPFVLNPPKSLSEETSFDEISRLLEEETTLLYKNLKDIPEDAAGHIVFPDPIAYYPNLIQCIHLLVIHEQHHFNIVDNYTFEQS